MRILIDTNILIYFLKGSSLMRKFLMRFQQEDMALSAITFTEILIGYKHHLLTLDSMKTLLAGFTVLPFTKPVAELCASFILKSTKKHHILGDAAIAATALHYGLTLVTNNPKDFRKFSGLKIITPRN